MEDYVALPWNLRRKFLAQMDLDTFDDSRMFDLVGIITSYVGWTMLLRSKARKKISDLSFAREESRMKSELEQFEDNLVEAFDEDRLMLDPLTVSG